MDCFLKPNIKEVKLCVYNILDAGLCEKGKHF